jgi:hypothetical protein
MTLFRYPRRPYNRCITGYATHVHDVGTVIVKPFAGSADPNLRWQARATLSGVVCAGRTRDEAVANVIAVLNEQKEGA